MRKWVGVLGAIALTGASLIVTAPAGATDGELDAVLGGDGVVTVPGLDDAWDMAAAPGSKVVVVGRSGTQPAVVRLNEDGTPDTTFDEDGVALIAKPNVGASGSANAVAVAADGSIAVAGSFAFDGEFTARLSSTGTPISTFGETGGVIYNEYEGMGASRDVAVTAAGTVYRLFVCCGIPPYSAVHKYSSTGDETVFETPGPPAPNMGFDPNHLLLQSDGKILLVGSSFHTTNGYSRLAARRITSAGATDTTYSSDGFAFAGQGDFGAGGLVGSKLVVAGTYQDDSAVQHVYVTKFGSDGVVDATFGGGDGFDDRAAPTGMYSVTDVVTRPDGRFYLVGQPISDSTNLVLQRRTATGAPDTAFSGDGDLSVPIGTASSTTAGSLGPAGDLYALGGGSSSRELARVDGTTDTAAPTGVAVTGPTARFVLSKTLNPKWAATDPSGIGGYEVTRLGAAYNAVLPTTWSAFYTGTATTSPHATDFGKTQCFRQRAKDKWGTYSAFSARRCAAVPLTSSSLAYSTGWTTTPSSAAFSGAMRTTTKTGATATRTYVYAERVASVVTKCKSCGTVKVKYSGTIGSTAYKVTSATISLVAASTVSKQIIQLPALPGLFRGTVTVTVTSATGKNVRIEGLGLYKD